MREWQEVTLADTSASVDYGYTASSAAEPVGPKFLRITDIAGPSLDWADVPYCEIGDEALEKFILREGDIVVARTGATVGYGRWVSPPEPSVFASYLVRFRPSDDVNSRFLGHVVESSTYKEFIQRSAGGAAQPNANAKVLGSFPFLLPDRATQDRVVSLLQPIDDLVENNRRRIALLELMAQALYREWFVRLRYPDHETDRLVDSPIGPIPTSWRVCTVGESFTTVLGGTPSRANPDLWGGDVPWLNSSKTNELRVIEPSEYITELGLARSSTKLMPAKTTLIAITGATLGQVSMLESQMCANQSVVGVYDESGRDGEWIYRTFVDRIEEVIQSASGGAQQHINKGVVESVVIGEPPREVLTAFSRVAGPLGDEITSLLRVSVRLGETRDLLLPKLVTGAIDVSKLDPDSIHEESAA